MSNPVENLKSLLYEEKENKKSYTFNNDGNVFINEKVEGKPEVCIWVQGLKFILETGEGFEIEEAREVLQKVRSILNLPGPHDDSSKEEIKLGDVLIYLGDEGEQIGVVKATNSMSVVRVGSGQQSETVYPHSFIEVIPATKRSLKMASCLNK